MVLEHLEGDGALAGDHGGVVVRVHEHPALGGRDAMGLGGALGEVLAEEDDPGAQHLRAVHLHEGGVGGHDDGGVDAEPGGVAGHGLGVVAGRHGHDAAGPVLRAERQQLVEGAPLLEGGRELQVLELHDHVGAEHGGQRLRPGAGRALDGAGDPLGGGQHVVERDGRLRGVCGHGATIARARAVGRRLHPASARSGSERPERVGVVEDGGVRDGAGTGPARDCHQPVGPREAGVGQVGPEPAAGVEVWWQRHRRGGRRRRGWRLVPPRSRACRRPTRASPARHSGRGWPGPPPTRPRVPASGTRSSQAPRATAASSAPSEVRGSSRQIGRVEALRPAGRGRRGRQARAAAPGRPVRPRRGA